MEKEKELLKALNIIKNYCKEHSEAKDADGNFQECKSCLLRNKSGGCGLFENQYGVNIESPEEWKLIKENVPKLFIY